LLSINTGEYENSIIDNDLETPMHSWYDDTKLLLMEEGKLEDGHSASGTPMVGFIHPAYRQKSEEYDENSKTPLTQGAVWPAGMSKVQPLAPLDLGPGWYQLDKLIGSESLVESAVIVGHLGEVEATSKRKRD
jgi:hypothetical protein